MATISVSLPSDGQTIDASDYNTPITTIVNEINGALDNSNIAAAAAIAGTKLATAGVTPGIWTNPYCFSAYGSGTTGLTDATAVKIAFATEEYDYNSNFASSTYTAPLAGVYHFDALITNAGAFASPQTFFCMLYKNGAEFKRGHRFTPGTVGTDSTALSCDVLSAASDTWEIYAYQDSAAGETTEIGQAVTYFSGHLVHKI